MSLVKGVILNFSLKQKLKLKSYIEGYLLGAHNGLSLFLWIKNFVEAQCYTVEHNIFYQDNNSSVLMENN